MKNGDLVLILNAYFNQ